MSVHCNFVFAFQAKLISERHAGGGSGSENVDNLLNFEDVQQFLRGQGRPGEEKFGKLTLADVRSKFQGNQDEMERLKIEVSRKREQEKVGELRALKQRSQELSLRRDNEQAVRSCLKQSCSIPGCSLTRSSIC